MIFRQLFDSVSSTYTYLLASRAGGEALLIDPVFEKTDRYLQLLEELDLKLVKVVRINQVRPRRPPRVLTGRALLKTHQNKTMDS